MADATLHVGVIVGGPRLGLLPAVTRVGEHLVGVVLRSDAVRGQRLEDIPDGSPG